MRSVLFQIVFGVENKVDEAGPLLKIDSNVCIRLIYKLITYYGGTVSRARISVRARILPFTGPSNHSGYVCMYIDIELYRHTQISQIKM